MSSSAYEALPSESHQQSRDYPPSPVYDANSREGGKPLMPSELSMAERKARWWRDAVVNTVFIASWFAFATLLSLYNKWMFSPDKFGFPFPFFVTTVHMLVQFCFAALLRAVFPRQFRPSQRPTWENYGKKAVPTAVTTGADIGLSNLSLKTVTLSFYTMCKSSSLIFVLLFAFAFKLERFSWRLVSVILIITSGVIMMVASETQFQLVGMILVLSASAFGGLRWALTQMLLKEREMGMSNPAATVFWLAPSMAITLAFLCAVVEGVGNVFHSPFFDNWTIGMQTVGYIVAPGTLAFCMVMSEYYIVQRVGMVPLSIAGIFKEVSTITLSTWVFGDNLTPINIVGLLITLGGICLFTYHKYEKSISEPVDAHGNTLEEEEEEEEMMRPLVEGGGHVLRRDSTEADGAGG